jgi:general secretion pathway protein F/type IV pilus assembly protein PilC
LARVAEDLGLCIETGMRLADATDRHKDVFPDAVRHVIRIGEETGNLDRTLMDAADHLARVHQIRADTKKSLIYPCFVVAAILGATAFWVYYVIPAVADLFLHLNVELPRITLFVLSAVEFLEHNLRAMLVMASLGVASLFLCFRLVPWFPKHFHRLLTVLPVTGKIVRASNLAFIAEYFSLLISSGIDVLRSLEILQSSVYNQVYKERLGAIRKGLLRGNTLTQEFGRAQVFPSFVVRMINVGEQSGNLAEQLQYVAADYRRRLDNTIDRISEIMKPVAILVVGAFFVFIVVALFLPIYYLVGEISARATY